MPFMKVPQSRGQALVEYLLALAACLLALGAAAVLLSRGLDAYWDSLVFWLQFPTP